MALSAMQLAGEYLFELYNAADHVSKCAQNAQEAVKHSDTAEALEFLGACRRSAEYLEMRYHDAVEAIHRAEAASLQKNKGETA